MRDVDSFVGLVGSLTLARATALAAGLVDMTQAAERFEAAQDIQKGPVPLPGQRQGEAETGSPTA